MNADHDAIHHYSQAGSRPIAAAREVFVTAVAFLALAIIRGAAQPPPGGKSGRDGAANRGPETDRPEEASRILSDLAPVLLPLIGSLWVTSEKEAAS